MGSLPEGKIETITGISASAMPEVDVPLAYTATPRTYALPTVPTANIAGFLQTIADNSNQTISIAIEEGQAVLGIAANTAIAIGDKLRLDATDPKRLTKLTPSVSGAPTGYADSVGEAMEVPAAVGAKFLFKFKKERIAV